MKLNPNNWRTWAAKALKGYLIVVAIGGSIHMTLVLITGVWQRDLRPLSPVTLMGLNYAFPELQYDLAANLVVLAALIAGTAMVLSLLYARSRRLRA